MRGTESIFSEDFQEQPYWWSQWQPHDDAPLPVPREVEYAIVGAGYAGLCCALELAQHGKQVVVLEAGLPGSGASTLSGGQVTGGINVGKTMASKKASGSAATSTSVTCCGRLRKVTAFLSS